MRVRAMVMTGAILALGALGGCSGGAAPTAAPSDAMAAVECGAAGTGTGVDIADFAYLPSPASVAVGGMATWTNRDGVTHTVSFDGGPDCGNVAVGASETVLFSVAGTYPYHCNIHSQMRGTITVV